MDINRSIALPDDDNVLVAVEIDVGSIQVEPGSGRQGRRIEAAATQRTERNGAGGAGQYQVR